MDTIRLIKPPGGYDITGSEPKNHFAESDIFFVRLMDDNCPEFGPTGLF